MTGNFVLSAEMAALVADYNANVKERDVKEMLHPKLKMLPPLHIYLVMYIANFFFLALNKTGIVQKALFFFHLLFFFFPVISSHTE